MSAPLRPPMTVLGLTGSIGMGKSTTAGVFRRLGFPVHDADAEVHRMFAPGGDAVAPVAEAFPGVLTDGAVDRDKLGRRVFDDPAALKRLEAIVHPRVHAAERRFLRRAALGPADIVVLDIPLLFETGGERRCDAVVVVSAPEFLQAQRVLQRPGMTRDKLAAIRARQMPDVDKRRRADYVVPTGLGKSVSVAEVQHIVAEVRRTRPRAPRRRGWSLFAGPGTV